MIGVRMATVLRDFPDFEPEKQFEAALALYHLRVGTKVLQQGKLSVIGRFMLRALAIGKESIGEVAHLLGLEEKDLAIAADELMRSELVFQPLASGGHTRKLALTPKGRSQLQEGKGLLVPRRRTFHLHWNSLTHAMRVRDDEAISVEEARKFGLFTIQGRGQRPTIGDLSLQEVRDAILSDPGTPDDLRYHFDCRSRTSLGGVSARRRSLRFAPPANGRASLRCLHRHAVFGGGISSHSTDA